MLTHKAQVSELSLASNNVIYIEITCIQMCWQTLCLAKTWSIHTNIRGMCIQILTMTVHDKIHLYGFH